MQRDFAPSTTQGGSAGALYSLTHTHTHTHARTHARTRAYVMDGEMSMDVKKIVKK